MTIAVSDFARSAAFYDAALAPLGIARLHTFDDRTAGYGRDGKAFFWIVAQDRPPTQGHFAFKAATEDEVAAFYHAALAHGGQDNGGPGKRPEYHDRYYAAFAIDPDGNNIEAVIQ